MPSINDFYEAMALHVPDDARILMCQFRGNPDDDIKGKWRARVVDTTKLIDPSANVYFCVSAMKRNARGEFRRRKENFAGGLLLMIDDIGTGKGAKFSMDVLDPLAPSAMIETSPDNFQAVYLFDSLVEDMRLFDALIAAFIEKEFLGKDTGMAGVNRVFRPPAGVNGKPKYGGWDVRLAEFHPERRYSVAEIAEAFRLTLKPRGAKIPRGATSNKADNIRAFISVRSALRAAGMLKDDRADLAGWTNMICPWTHEHTGSVDNGAALRIPDEDNGFFGGFKCFHGACAGRGWRELTEWLADEQGEVMEMINETAGEYEDYATT